MILLSLFNGIGVGTQALKNIGVKIEKAYISEIDKFANQTNMKNHPESIQLGDITKWREWDIDWANVDLVTAGFPCQAWSVAGQQMGDRDERGALFWTTLDVIANVLKHNPSAKFLMENVRMKKEFEEYITHHTEQALGYVEKTLINSALVTAQNRNRYYWTNFKVSQPEDRKIFLKDIIEDIPGDRPCDPISDDLSAGHVANATDIKGMESLKRVYGVDGKAPTLTTMQGGHRQPKVICREELKNESAMGGVKSYTLTASYSGAVAWNSCQRKQRTMIPVSESDKKDPNVYNGVLYRKLTPLECERLQGYPDQYTEGVSNTQRYKQIGNGWTLPVIEHIFRDMMKEI